MAKRDEIIRYVIETTGDKALAATVGQLLDAAKASGQTAEQIDALGESLRSLATDAAETKGLQDAVARFGELAAKQEEVADAADRAGLALKLSMDAERAAADALAEKNAALAAAKAAQAEYLKGEDRLITVQRELATAVKGAASEQKAANAEWKSASANLAQTTRDYEKAADAQSRIGTEMAGLENRLSAATLSTGDLAAAQRDLAARAQSVEQGLAGIAKQSSDASKFSAELADETKRARAEHDQAAAAIKRHQEAMSRASRETAGLGKETTVVTGALGKLKSVLAPIAGVFSFASLATGLRRVIGAADESEQAFGQLEAVLESTRGAAGLTKSALVEMAEELAKSSNFGKNEIIAAQTRLLSYTDVAGKEFPRALQIVLDQSQRLGISVQQSAEIVGKALQAPSDAMSSLARQGFKLEDGQKQLLQQMEATGRTAEAQAIIMDMLAESYGGAAAKARVSTIAGLWRGLTKTVGEFFERVGNAGVIDYLKGRLDALTRAIANLDANGSLQRWATNVSDAIIGVAKAVEGAARFIAQNAEALTVLAKAYALVKVQQFVDGLASVASGASKANGALRLMATAITSLPPVRILVIGGAAIALATDNLKELGDKLAENLPASERWRTATAAMQAETVRLAEKYREATASLDQYREVQIKSAVDAARLGAEERAAYAERLQGLEEYLRAQERYYEQLRRADALNDAGLRYLETLKGQLAQVSIGYDDLAASADAARDAFGNQLTTAAQMLVGKLSGLGDSTKGAADRIGELLKNFEQLNTVQLGDIALALQALGEDSDRSAQRIRDGLGAQLAKLSAEELQRFQMSATAAFDAVGRSGEKTAVVLDATLNSAMSRLNVDAGKTGEAFTTAGREIITTFGVVADNARATSGQIAAAFSAALGGVKTRQEAEALAQAFRALGEQGRVGGGIVEQAMQAVRDRLREIDASMDPLSGKFAQFGLKSQAALNATAQSAREFFDQVSAGAQEGRYAQEDVIRAFRAWAAAARAAAVDSSAAVRAQVEAQIEAQAAVLGLTEELKRAGDAGADAGRRTAAGFQQAGAAAANTAKIVDAVGNAGAQVGASVDTATAAINRMAAETEAARGPMKSLTVDLSEFGAAAVQAFSDAQDAAFQYSISNAADAVRYTDQINNANRRITETFEAQKGAAAQFVETYSNLTDVQLEQMARQHGGYEQLLAAMRTTVAVTQDANGAFSMLNNADLSRVQQAAQAVEQQLQQIVDRAQSARDSMQSMADSLQDQIDQINGRQDASEERRYENQLKQLQQQAEQAGILGTAEYAAAVARANELHSLKMKQIKEEAAARKAEETSSANTTSTSTTTTKPQTTTQQQPQAGATFGVIKFDLGGQTVDVRGTKDTAADLKNMIDTLRRARARTGGWG